MRGRFVGLAIALLVAGVLTVAAADISGKWAAEIAGRAGGNPTQTTFTFKVEGGKLTGTVTSARGDSQITEGTVAGDTVSFVVVRQGGQGEVKELYKGTVAGNEIKFTRTRAGAPGAPGAPGAAGAAGGAGGGGGRGGAPIEFVAKRAS